MPKKKQNLEKMKINKQVSYLVKVRNGYVTYNVEHGVQSVKLLFKRYLVAYAYVDMGLIGKYNLAREIPNRFR